MQKTATKTERATATRGDYRIALIEDAAAAILNGNNHALARAARDIADAMDWEALFTAPLLLVADYLAKDPAFAPQAVSAYQAVVERNRLLSFSEQYKQANTGILNCAEHLPDAKARVDAYEFLLIHSDFMNKLGPQAVAGMMRQVGQLTEASDRAYVYKKVLNWCDSNSELAQQAAVGLIGEADLHLTEIEDRIDAYTNALRVLPEGELEREVAERCIACIGQLPENERMDAYKEAAADSTGTLERLATAAFCELVEQLPLIPARIEAYEEALEQTVSTYATELQLRSAAGILAHVEKLENVPERMRLYRVVADVLHDGSDLERQAVDGYIKNYEQLSDLERGKLLSQDVSSRSKMLRDALQNKRDTDHAAIAALNLPEPEPEPPTFERSMQDFVARFRPG